MDLGLGAAFRHLGWRNDVPEIMRCCDWFILPHPEHPMEGFGLAVVEAQLAGLRMLISTGVPDDPLLPTASCARLPSPPAPKHGQTREWNSGAGRRIRRPMHGLRFWRRHLQ